MIIIDIGAGNGLGVTRPYAANADNTVYAFEADATLAAQLKALALSNVHVFTLAAGQVDDGQTTRLNTFLAHHQVLHVDFLNVGPVEASYPVILGLGERLHDVNRLSCNVALTEKETVADYLTAKGFRLLSAFGQADGLAENLVFTRVNRYVSDLPTDAALTVQVPYVGSLHMPQSDLVGLNLQEGVFEGPEQAFFWLYLQPGDTFLDCGTHAGLFSALAAQRIGKTGQIVGFDPNPDCVAIYRKNLAQFDVSHIHAFHQGLGRQVSEATFVVESKGRAAFGHFVTDSTAQTSSSTVEITVPINTIDHVLAALNIEAVALAKLDVEGWEHYVLEGAQSGIAARKIACWMIEFTQENAHSAGTSVENLYRQVTGYGYTLCQFNPTTLQLNPAACRAYAYDNLFAVWDVDAVNTRLACATETDQNIARQIIHNWDTAMRANNSSAAYEALRSELARQAGHYESALSEAAVREARLLQLQTDDAATIRTLEAEIQTLMSPKGLYIISKKLMGWS